MPTFLEQTFGGGSPSPSPYQQLLNYQQQYWASPMGLAERDAYDQTNSLNRQQVLAQMQAQRDQIALQRGTVEADRWYRGEQLKLARQQHELAVQQLQQQGRQFDVTATGYLDGSPTLTRQQFEAGTTGYYGGNPTLAREQAAANIALQAAQLGASLRGPRNWGAYLEAANNVAGSPVSALVRSTPGGLGMAADQGRQQRQTLSGVLGDFGVNGGGNVPTGAAPASGAGAPLSGGATNANLGLSDADAASLRNTFRNPHQAAGGWLESKTRSQREYLAGLADQWGEDWDTVEDRYMNSRTRQGHAQAA